jgi:monoamine oxidase
LEEARSDAGLETTRRELLAGAAATGTGLLLPAELTAAARRRRGRRRVDVAIVGAGLAGLTTAGRLARAGKEVCVIEARDRVGGRVLNRRVARGVIAEVGGQFVGPTQDRLLALAKSVGVGTFPTHNEGENVLLLGGRRSLYAANPGLSPDPQFQEAILRAITRLDPMAAEVPVEAPWKAPRAEEWDSLTLEAWKQQNLSSEGAKKLFDVACEAIWGAEPREISLLYALAYIAAAGNDTEEGSFVRLISTPGGAQQSRFVGGSQRIARRAARPLGEQVVLSSPVRSIVQGGGRALVTSDRLVVEADQVIVALPPVLAARIEYTPALPRAKRMLLKRIVPGELIKWQAVYQEPFWREQGLSGQAVSDVGPAYTTFDNTPPSGAPGILLGFVGGAQARPFAKLSRGARRSAVLANFVELFGDTAADPRASFELNWAGEAWTRGCPVGHMGRNVLTRFGPALRRRTGRIHWAGAETATYWNGYMDGAVRSGERAAAEALRALRRPAG